MAAESAGQIGLDLVINQGEFKKQLAGIQGMAKKQALLWRRRLVLRN